MKADREKIKLALARSCMNIGELPSITGMPLPTIKNAFAGRGVRPGTLGKIAKALHVDVVDILTDEQSQQEENSHARTGVD